MSLHQDSVNDNEYLKRKCGYTNRLIKIYGHSFNLKIQGTINLYVFEMTSHEVIIWF